MPGPTLVLLLLLLLSCIGLSSATATSRVHPVVTHAHRPQRARHDLRALRPLSTSAAPSPALTGRPTSGFATPLPGDVPVALAALLPLAAFALLGALAGGLPRRDPSPARWALQAASGTRAEEPTTERQERFGFGATATDSQAERQDLFNGIAPAYDLLNDALSLGQHRLWKLETVARSGARPGDRVLDLCCGSGDLALLLALRVGPQGAVTAADFAADMLRRGERRVTDPLRTPLRLLSAPIDWVQADALALPFPDESFDAATMGYGLRNVVSIPEALAELRRVLKPGGTAAILDFHRPSNGVVAAFQKQYLDSLVVPAATLAGLEREYRYIMPSLEAFPTGPEQVNLALAANFRSATHTEIAAGLMGCLVVQR